MNMRASPEQCETGQLSQGTGNLGGIAEIKDPKSGEQISVFSSARTGYTPNYDDSEYMRSVQGVEYCRADYQICGVVKVKPGAEKPAC